MAEEKNSHFRLFFLPDAKIEVNMDVGTSFAVIPSVIRDQMLKDKVHEKLTITCNRNINDLPSRSINGS